MKLLRGAKSVGQADELSRLLKRQPLTQEDSVVASVEVDVKQVFADAVRRLPVTAETIRKHTEKSVMLRKLKSFIDSGRWPKVVKGAWKHFHNRRESLSLVQGCVMLSDRVVVPETLRAVVLKELHTGHPGIVRMKSLARSYVYWPNIDEDCERTVQGCTDCQLQSKTPAKVPLQMWKSAQEVWERIHVDFAGPLHGTCYMVVVDAMNPTGKVA
ncbi:hypothetical protein Y032_0044g925 [Ancylostoma ceylanicum]|uniref:RNA-directed DNA polymerase n=1 Tax=Ancylostoma ceylanicum TaxID=53326 RepID=A0A016UDB6_9BILA|nr:hypothetical protein Y032_0044g925 [Ancylostoma ceylanicum]